MKNERLRAERWIVEPFDDVLNCLKIYSELFPFLLDTELKQFRNLVEKTVNEFGVSDEFTPEMLAMFLGLGIEFDRELLFKAELDKFPVSVRNFVSVLYLPFCDDIRFLILDFL